MLKLSSSGGIRIDVPVLSVSWSFEDHSVIIQALRIGFIEREASDTGGVLRWKSSCPDRLAEATCPTPKVIPRFSLGDVGESRWLLSHRWTETSPILPDVAYDSRNQCRMVSRSALGLLSACVRPRQLREVHHNLQRAPNP